MYFNKIRVRIFSSYVNAMIDTGATISLISEALQNRLGVSHQKLDRQDPKFLFGANGAEIRIIGKVQLSIKLNGLCIPFDFLVAHNLRQDMLLGTDFLSKSNALIDYTNNTVTFYDNLVQVNILETRANIVARLRSACTLPPRSETFVPVVLSKKISGQNFFLEPLPIQEGQKFLVAKILTNIKDGHTFCRILNTTNQPLRLNKLRTVAIVHKILPQDCTSAHHINALSTSSSGSHSFNPQSHNRNQMSNHSRSPHQSPSFTQGVFRTVEELGIKIENENLTRAKESVRTVA